MSRPRPAIPKTPAGCLCQPVPDRRGLGNLTSRHSGGVGIVSRISRRRALGMLASAAGVAGLASLGGASSVLGESDLDDAPALDGRLVATGIPGASAVAPVGTFLPGGPIHDNPVLHAFTQPGRVLDPTRILVGGRSNFGAPKAN